MLCEGKINFYRDGDGCRLGKMFLMSKCKFLYTILLFTLICDLKDCYSRNKTRSS